MKRTARRIVEEAVNGRAVTKQRAFDVEMLGDEGLAELVQIINSGSLPSTAFVNATQLLYVLARHNGFERKPRAIDSILPFVESDDTAIRSRAAYFVASQGRLLRALYRLPSAVAREARELETIEARVNAAIVQAKLRGLAGPDSERLAAIERMGAGTFDESLGELKDDGD